MANDGIISLISSGTEILYGLGLGPRMLAVSHECDFPAEVRGKPRATFSRVDVGRSSREIDQQVRTADQMYVLYGIAEDLIRQLQPGWIVTQSQCDVCAVRYADVAELVRKDPVLADTQLIDLDPHVLADVLDDIRKIGAATGTAAAAEAWVDRLQERVARIASTTSTLTEEQRPRVACIEWTEPLMLAANWTPELIRLAGGRCPDDAGAHSRYRAWEEVVQYDPEVIVVSPCGFDLKRTLVEAEPLLQNANWEQIAAVRAGRVYAVDGNAYLNRSGPRLVDSIEILCHLFQPTFFPQPMIAAGTDWLPLAGAS